MAAPATVAPLQSFRQGVEVSESPPTFTAPPAARHLLRLKWTLLVLHCSHQTAEAAGVGEIDGISADVRVFIALKQVACLVEGVGLGPAGVGGVVVALAVVVEVAGREVAAGVFEPIPSPIAATPRAA